MTSGGKSEARTSPLFTDLYEVTMAEAYLARHMTETAVFETYFRSLPHTRGYVVAAGLEDVLAFLENFRFSADDVDYLRRLGSFSAELLEWLSRARFSGDVWAVPEGTIVFPHEPLVQVRAPIAEAQLAETFVLNQLHVQSVLASKAARVVQAARGRSVVDFGSRRAHGTDAALKLARVSYLAGAAGTSNLAAARAYEIPPFGTMAHSFVQAFDTESAAFEAFSRIFPGTTLLVDTYDTRRGIRRVIELAERLGPAFDVHAVRLDSGDLRELSKAARADLDRAGLQRVGIFASSDLDEAKIDELLRAGCPIDGFGVGTRWCVSADAPTLDMAYKLVEYAGRGRTKLSSAKAIYPSRKQIFRTTVNGRFTGDTLGGADERLPGEPLLVPVMQNGRRLPAGVTSLSAARRRLEEQRAALPQDVDGLVPPIAVYPVTVSPYILDLLARARAGSY